VPPHPEWSNALKPAGEAGPELTLARDGMTGYVIVLPESPTTQEEKAAADLAHWLGLATGAEFNVVREGSGESRPERGMSVGRTRLLERADLPQKEADLGKEGIAIAVDGENLYLFGGSRRGPIYAVYSFLEEDLGFRWYARGTATIPDSPTLTVRPVPRTFAPPLVRRDPFYSDAHNVEWSLRNKTSSHRAPVPAAWGGHPRYPMHFVHTYNLLMPPDEFFDEHPEYYSEINGVRQPSQLCPTDPDVQRIMAERILERLAKCPDCRYVDCSPNDWRGYCECETCSALDEEEGSKAASMLQLVNHVADRVAEVRPDVQVTTLAYLGTFMPPRTVRPRENVLIVLCTDTHAWDFLFLDVTETENFSRALEAWSETRAHFMIWDYAVDFYNHMRPLPNMRVVERNIRMFVEHGATGIIEQGAHRTNYGIDRCRMRSWVWAKLLWDPTRDQEALIRDFCLGYYGDSGDTMLEYDGMLHDAWKEAHDEWKRRHPGAVTPDSEEYAKVFFPGTRDFSDETIRRMAVLLTEAERSAQGNEYLVRRVEYGGLPILYVQAESGPWPEREEYLVLLNKFERIARREGAVFTKDAYGEPNLDTRLMLWRGMALIDAERVHFEELDNEWRFKPDPENVGVAEEWFRPDLDDSAWGIVRSDLGHRGWESQGFAEYTTGYGWYRQDFYVPEDFPELPNPRLFFGAVDEEAEIWINGEKALSHTADVVGLSKDFLWRRPFLFDPVRHLRPGETNQLTVRVHNALHVGGIWKPVRLLWGEPVEDPFVLDEFLRRMQERKDR
jgi:hypothetical protein